ncbi:MAG: hypothetical protein JRN15_03260 [Nitrososphaerota archaeon]|nr:hypothetical protein [Nitrososphaerota archaeon]
MKNVIGVVLVVVLIAMTGIALYYSTTNASPNTITITTTSYQGSILTADPFQYFNTGYYTEPVDISRLSDGNNLTVGDTTFQYIVPSNLETRTTTITGVSTVITITADYQCGTSLGQRRYFLANLPGGNVVKLDYCLVLNEAACEMQQSNNFTKSWSIWQVSVGTYPTVAIHLAGLGLDPSLVELWVSK